MNRLVLASIVLLFSALTLPGVLHAQSYRVVEPPIPHRLWHGDVNDSLRVVGVHSFEDRFIPTTWQGSESRTLLSIPPEATQLRINNTGMIAGVREIDRFPRTTAVFVTDFFGNGYTETLLPPRTSATVGRLTDSGIFHLQVLYIAADLVNVTDERDFALYRGQLYDLSGSRTLSRVHDIGEDGRALVHDNLGRRFLRWPDGRTAFPWPPMTPVVRIGEGGHFAGSSFSTASGASVISYGTQYGGVNTLAVQGLVEVKDVNRAGDIVGNVAYGGTFEDQIRNYGFVMRGGVLIDLNSLVSIPGYHIVSASRISSSGAIIGRISPLGWSVPTGSVLLTPVGPAKPARPMFTVVGRVVTVQWDAVAGALEYILEAGSGPGRADLYNASVGAGTSLTTPAPPGRYYVRVRARGGDGTSEPSTEMIIDVP